MFLFAVLYASLKCLDSLYVPDKFNAELALEFNSFALFISPDIMVLNSSISVFLSRRFLISLADSADFLMISPCIDLFTLTILFNVSSTILSFSLDDSIPISASLLFFSMSSISEPALSNFFVSAFKSVTSLMILS